MSKIYFREVSEVRENELYPGNVFSDEYFVSNRHMAIAEVLARIPKEDYEKLIGLSDSFHWFIPHPQVDGLVFPFPVNYDPGVLKSIKFSRVIYLSPNLEKSHRNIIVATVAHELAHISLDHKFYAEGKEYEKQEEEAFKCMVAWGFEVEANKLQVLIKWKNSRDEKILKKLKSHQDS